MSIRSQPSISPITIVGGASTGTGCFAAASSAPRQVGNYRVTAPPVWTMLIALIGLFLLAAPPVAAQDKTYNQPRHFDDRLDWCLTWGTNCGKPAAVAFCNRRRFADVVVFRAEKVGKSARTRLIGSNQICSGQDFCTAFAYITCTAPISSDRVFANPAWKGNRLDVCLQWGANCGKPAADAFCRANGFAESFQAVEDADPGYAATRVIGTDQICNKSFCRGFQQIICK